MGGTGGWLEGFRYPRLIGRRVRRMRRGCPTGSPLLVPIGRPSRRWRTSHRCSWRSPRHRRRRPCPRCGRRRRKACGRCARSGSGCSESPRRPAPSGAERQIGHRSRDRRTRRWAWPFQSPFPGMLPCAEQRISMPQRGGPHLHSLAPPAKAHLRSARASVAPLGPRRRSFLAPIVVVVTPSVNGGHWRLVVANPSLPRAQSCGRAASRSPAQSPPPAPCRRRQGRL